MKVRLVFDDWRVAGKSIYNTEDGIALSMGQLHSGSTFTGTIDVDPGEDKELQQALDMGFQPVFYLIGDDNDSHN